MTGTFIVTIVVCTFTGLTLIITGFWDQTGGLISGITHDPSLEAGALTVLPNPKYAPCSSLFSNPSSSAFS